MKWLRHVVWCVALGLGGLNLPAAEAAKKAFDIPAGIAPGTLKQFSAQAGGHLLYSAEAVEGVKTNAVKGELTACEVLDRMLTGTGLVFKQDEKTGALAIMHATSANDRGGSADASRGPTSSIAKKKTKP